MAKINTRSPYYITLTATNLTQVNFDIHGVREEPTAAGHR